MDIYKQRYILLPVFFLSGLSALVYEIIWARMLSTVFGSTVEAVSAVVTAYMFGLALGSYFMGKKVDRLKDIFLTYSLIEAAIGISGLSLYFLIVFLPDILHVINNVVRLEDRTVFHGSSYVFEFLLIVVPTTFMGATFPLMIRSYVYSSYFIGRGTAVVYAINTLGAVVGSFAAGFFLIPVLGIRMSVFFAISINILLAFFIGISRKKIRPLTGNELSTIRSDSMSDRRDASFFPAEGMLWLVLIVTAISGFASMAYQVAWTRLLSMVIGNSVYAFSCILTTFLIGISLGSFLFLRKTDWGVKDKLLFLGAIQVALFILVVASVPMMNYLPAVFMILFKNTPDTFIYTTIIDFIVSAGTVFVPSLLMGIAFPIAVKLYAGAAGEDVMGRRTGILYSANTFGCIFGSFITGFYLIPNIGVQKTIIAVSGLNLIGGTILLFQSPSLKMHVKAAIVTGLAGVYIFSIAQYSAWNIRLLNLGVYYQAPMIRNIKLTDLTDEAKLLYYKEGVGGTVAVTKLFNNLSLQINGKTEGGNTEVDIPTQSMLSFLPTLMHPDPKDMAVIGLGTGVSIGAATLFPLKSIDCIEILPEVAEADRYFSKFNHNALNDKRVNLIIDDGRRYLTYTDKKYDILVSEPSNPWIKGSSNLFTVEFFKVAKGRLKEDGLMAQWIQLYSLDTKELKSLVKTFTQVFPHVSAWTPSELDLILIGSQKKIPLDLANVQRWYEVDGMRAEFEMIGLRTPEAWADRFLIGTEGLKEFSKGARMNTDDHPIIEFEAPKTIYLPTAEKNLRAMLSTAATLMR